MKNNREHTPIDDTTYQCRHWCFTLNNYTELEIAQINIFDCRYIVYGFETSKSGTPHLQGYIELNQPKRLSALKKALNNRAYFGIRKGTRERARDYCLKGEQTKAEWKAHQEKGENWGLNAKVFINGDFQAGGSGKRNDIRSLKKQIESGAPMIDIIADNFENYTKYHRSIVDYKRLCDSKNNREFRKLEVIVYWGVADTGKSRKAREENPDAFRAQKWSVAGNFMFDGYDGEDVIIIDDYLGGIPFDFLLNLLDGHPLTLNVKNSRATAKYTKVIFTSNKHPDDWYGYLETSSKQYKRRFTSIIEFKEEIPMMPVPL